MIKKVCYVWLLAGVLIGQGFLPRVFAQTVPAFLQPPQAYELLGIDVAGVKDAGTKAFIIQSSGLRVGQTLTLPGDEALREAIRRLYRLGIFSDVRILEDKKVGNGIFLLIQVKEEPRLAEYHFEGLKKGEAEELRKRVPLLRGRAVGRADIERTRQIMLEFLREKGYLLAEVEVEKKITDNNRAILIFKIKKGPIVEVKDIVFHGNKAFSDRTLRRKLKETKADRWWRFWGRARFDEMKYEEDKYNLIAFYNEKGYYDAHIVKDTVYLVNGEKPGIMIEITLHEGPRYYIRNITWEGNVEYTDEELTQALGFRKGDPYNSKKLESNLYGNPQSTDVASLYLNRGFMRFQAIPTIVEVPGDSLDIYFEVFEGDVYEFGEIRITGNTKTKEHVIRRELRTIPGQRFSRDAIQRSIRELMQLNYFNPEKIIPETRIDEEKKMVDLTYSLEEAGGDQLEFSGGWGGGTLGLLLQLRLTFNNFSAQSLFDKKAWRPLPAGDGQRLSIGVQVGGKVYQNYSFSFEEPWFRGRPTPIGFSITHSRYDYTRSAFGLGFQRSGFKFAMTAVRAFYSQRLKWPDDYFQFSTATGWRIYDISQQSSTGGVFGLPPGKSQELTFTQTLSRNSYDNPMFPMAGSDMTLSLDVAPPLGGQFVQYYKVRFKTTWNVPLWNRVSLSMGADYGFLGSITGKKVEFQRFLVGGTPLEAQYGYYGKDLVFMRGYPIEAITPRDDRGAVGGTILNKYSSELRLLAFQSPQFTLAPYLFFDAANTWDGLHDYNPTQLYRSAGIGARFFLPIVGMLEVIYGYNFDRFAARGNETGLPAWRFQFSIGQGF